MILDYLQKKPKEAKATDKGDDKLKRSVVKTISWRVIGTLDTVVISYIVTGGLNQALAIGGVELVTKMILYFFHERAWNKIKWGK